MSADYDSKIIEAALFASATPLNKDAMRLVLGENHTSKALDERLALIEARYVDHVMKLTKIASGWRFMVADEYSRYVSRLHATKPPKYSRAMLETIALIAYRQPITRGEIENVRGVAVSSNIIRGLIDRSWVRIIGYKEVPGRPALLATTPAFLDYFNLRSLSELPALADVRDLEEIGKELFGAEHQGVEQRTESGELGDDDYTLVTAGAVNNNETEEYKPDE